MTGMRQVRRALPRPSPIKCECCMVFGCVLPLFAAVPIVLMMLLYEARARASYRNIISTTGTPFLSVLN